MGKTNDDYVCITIKDLALDVRVGLLPAERVAAQRMLVSMDLYAAPDYMDGVDADSIIDYGEICARLQAWEARGHVDLLETLIEDAFAIAFSYPAVLRARAHVLKPDIIAPARAVGLEAARAR